MKHVYKKPKAVLVDFHYDEQVTANSNVGNFGRYGNVAIMVCQYSGGTGCSFFFSEGDGALCSNIAPASYDSEYDII